MSQETLGKKLKRNKSVVYGYENNVRIPPLNILVNIATISMFLLIISSESIKMKWFLLMDLATSKSKLFFSLINEFNKLPNQALNLTEVQQSIFNQILFEFNRKG